MPDYGILNLFGPHFPKDMIMDPDPRDATAELGKQYLEHGAKKYRNRRRGMETTFRRTE